ncbi:arylsulfatase [Pontibacter sp. G13]|uniref:arylsulfatase n=1 Tax=Pontibacter sp. G13 TaxID=3074898 RepID=UPI0028896B1C|nr:arylsulfatase [Pontibacter sp. G13]WNJ17306.1 arylsulfatase [Pontibacter sp. G13]
MHRTFQILLFCLLTTVLGCQFPPQPERKPNVLVILTDDQGWGDLGIHGNQHIHTPHLDALARSGTRFDRFYVSPVCAPTRAAFLTGRYPQKTGVYGVQNGEEFMNLEETTIADVFQQAGYRTGAFGKWHNGSQYPYHPNGRGFNEFYGYCSGHWANYFDTWLEHNGQPVKSQGFMTDDLTDHAMQFMEQHREEPFFCYVPFNTPHSPYQVPDSFYQAVRNRKIEQFYRDSTREELPKTIAALAMCENIDWNVGRLLNKLAELDLEEETIVVFFSDNGPNSWRWNGGMRDRKAGVHEGGVRVPCIIRWPGKIAANHVTRQLGAHFDLLPTLAALAGISAQTRFPVDGQSLSAVLLDRDAQVVDRTIYSQWREKLALRTAQYTATSQGLFDLTQDPGETHNLKDSLPELHASLVRQLEDFRQMAASHIPSERFLPVGHADRAITHLPVQDALFEGAGLTYSCRWPNSAWMTNWDQVDDYPYWKVDILNEGIYDVEIEYTCSEANVGAEIVLELGEFTCRGKIDTAFDPELIPSPDRVPREESYEKPFKTLKLGEIHLPRGAGKLSLRALAKPGDQVMDLRSITLIRQQSPTP